MTTGHKIGRSGKSYLEELKLDTPADAQISVTQVAKRQMQMTWERIKMQRDRKVNGVPWQQRKVGK